ncbi:hypothetical protein C7999DRAFT_14500 [Corynascus novoguineensis]|uniref:Uncharacterized protein n=1 Tax=Corynascus novoguineensis TaxID=1126955 RepID=A0AAN7HIZ6_9PEZI|nr:hypothetical protein C7999DRAFT_14500 [Corynascus novoguineensis]
MAAKPQPEARSLSAINYLAANPPQYPYHPEVREPLILYISRVPGTQDIILSTFRPREKTVTAEDITTSLYYVHLDAPGESLLAPPQDVTSPRSSSESVSSAIPRKPLPAAAKVAGPAVDDALSGSEPYQPTTPTGVLHPTASGHLTPTHDSGVQPHDAIPFTGYRENPMFRNRRSGVAVDVSDRPVGPTPPTMSSILRKPLSTVAPATDGASNIEPSVATDATAHQGHRGQISQETSSGHPERRVLHISSPTSPLQPGRKASPKKSESHPSSVAFSLTLIRRDPTSGTQCNVGKIMSFQTNVPTPETADPSLDPRSMGNLLPYTQKISIRLETSGYAKYRDMPTKTDLESHYPSTGLSFSQQLRQSVDPTSSTAGRTIPTPKPVSEVEQSFTREVVMSYGGSLKSNLIKAFQRINRPGSPVHGGDLSPEDPTAPKSFHARHGSASTIGSVESDGRRSPTLFTHPGPGLKPKGYVFMSPWNGRCEFRTSIDGRSLKCRHIMEPPATRIEPRELAQNIRDAQAMGRSRSEELASALMGAKQVSELRFSLPHAPSHRPPDADGKLRKAHRLSGQFSKLMYYRKSQSSDEESDGEDGLEESGAGTGMDLSLGKEHAGGGSKGKKAKLGKLIVHDEGLKMLDLVVAANVGVWWTSWEKMH